MPYVSGQSPFLGLILRLRWGENIDFYLLKHSHLYFTFLRWIDWDVEQSHTTTLKIPHDFGQSPFLGSTLRPHGGENIDFYLLKLLHSYFTFLRWIDWDKEQSHITTLKMPYVFGQSPFLGSTLRLRCGENIDFYILKLLHSYFTFLRWID